ncbi:hypothetical protein [Streptomyces sp. NPDC059455]|uniref:hypothetical protein n=1 Tax=Streptomyces sp. NPDC059455 TaxID=3346837 RepID=UPI00368B5AC3
MIVLATDDPHVPSGHDLTSAASGADFEPGGMTSGYRRPGQAGPMATEEEFYLGMCWRWRNVPNPTIAQVQGEVIARV